MEIAGAAEDLNNERNARLHGRFSFVDHGSLRYHNIREILKVPGVNTDRGNPLDANDIDNLSREAIRINDLILALGLSAIE